MLLYVHMYICAYVHIYVYRKHPKHNVEIISFICFANVCIARDKMKFMIC